MMAPSFITKNTVLRTHRHGYAVELFVVHETVGRFPGDMNHLIGSGIVSVNWYINRSGQLFCLDDMFGATAHAGAATWGRHTDPDEGYRNPKTDALEWGWANLASEGVELEGPNDGTPFTSSQIQRLLELTRWRCEVYKLNPAVAVVRHTDIAPKRKSDPRGLDWQWFKTQLTPPIATGPAPATISGNGRDYACDAEFRRFYDEHGGLLVFGWPTGDMITRADTSGEQCQFMPFENAWIKRKPSQPESWRLRPASIAEIIALRG